MKVSTYQGMHLSARPIRHSSSNNDRCNSFELPAEIYLKLENLQPIDSFKIGGAANAIAHLSLGQRRHGLRHRVVRACEGAGVQAFCDGGRHRGAFGRLSVGGHSSGHYRSRARLGSVHDQRSLISLRRGRLGSRSPVSACCHHPAARHRSQPPIRVPGTPGLGDTMGYGDTILNWVPGSGDTRVPGFPWSGKKRPLDVLFSSFSV
jgi:hypothetical protein